MLDFLGTAAPFVAIDELIEEIQVDVVDAALGPEPHEFLGSAFDLLTLSPGP